MADSPISGQGMTVKGVFSGRRYQLDHYQRDYSWGREEVRQLVEDLHGRFEVNYRPTHDRRKVAGYEPYFLGSFVYHEHEGTTFVVDGQQRITTLHILLIFLKRLLDDLGMDKEAVNLEPLIRTTDFGDSTYTIDIPERTPLLDRLFDDDYAPPSTMGAAERRLWEAADELDTSFPDDLRDEALPYFVDWLLHRVCLVGIKALNKEQGWEIYESVNDRGVRLGPLDLLKSLLLRNLDGQTDGMDVLWRNLVSGLAAVEPNAPARFIKAFFVGRYARTRADMELIEENFYAWFRDHAGARGLSKPRDYRGLLREMEAYARHYRTLAAASHRYDEQLKYVFFNQYNRQSEQFSPLLAALAPDDDPVLMKQKATLVAAYLDLIYIWRVVSGQPVADAHLAQLARDLVLDLRGAASAEAIRTILSARLRSLDYGFADMDTFGLQASNKRQVRYLLARLTAFVEVGCGKPDQCALYLAEQEPYEIEHVWANHFDRYQSTAVNSRQVFDAYRNRLGALVLLPKSDNASYRDDPFDKKVDYYQRRNDLAGSLHPRHRERNAKFNKFVASIGLDKAFRGYRSFDHKAIAERQTLYKQLCERVWDTTVFGVKPASFPQVADPAAHRTRARFDVALASLIDSGQLAANTELIGHRRQETYRARVLPDGRVQVATGEQFGSLSAAGQFVLQVKSCPGWTFWKIRRDGQDVPLAEIRRAALEGAALELTASVPREGR
jgi:hypothetical protein